MRWEVTRRNPYYSTMWRHSLAEHRKEPPRSSQEALIRQASIPTLGLIGVSGEPADPADSFDALGEEQLKQGWLSGAVHPITIRGLAALLIATLPKETLGQVGYACFTAARDEVEGQASRKIEAIQHLMQDNSAGLDDYVDEPIVSINPAASERKIGEAIYLLLKEWKDQRGLEERRDRSDKYEEYLQVWDLREGWNQGVYDRTTERTFVEIAEITHRSVSTLNNQYCRAFELIVGQPYSRERWLMCMGPIKLTEIIGMGMARTRRPTSSPASRPVPESIVMPVGLENATAMTQSVPANAEEDFSQLLMDLESLLSRGDSDAQIAAELELPPEAIAYVRKRGDMASLRA